MNTEREKPSSSQLTVSWLHIVRNQKGSGATLILAVAMMGIVLTQTLSIADMSRNSAMRVIMREAREKITDRTRAMIRNVLLTQYSMDNYNTPSINQKLKRCVMAGNPSGSDDCKNVNVDFYFPSNSGGEKFLGGVDNPSYASASGDNCESASASHCPLKTQARCTFTCPGGQTQCALTKVMICDLEILPNAGNTIFHAFSFSKSYNNAAAMYAIRLNNDLNSYSVNR